MQDPNQPAAWHSTLRFSVHSRLRSCKACSLHVRPLDLAAHWPSNSCLKSGPNLATAALLRPPTHLHFRVLALGGESLLFRKQVEALQPAALLLLLLLLVSQRLLAAGRTSVKDCLLQGVGRIQLCCKLRQGRRRAGSACRLPPAPLALPLALLLFLLLLLVRRGSLPSATLALPLLCLLRLLLQGCHVVRLASSQPSHRLRIRLPAGCRRRLLPRLLSLGGRSGGSSRRLLQQQRGRTLWSLYCLLALQRQGTNVRRRQG